MRNCIACGLLAALVLATANTAAAEEEVPYTQEEDHVYLSLDGQDFYMDIFRPKEADGPGEGLGIIDIASGAWSSDRGKIADHKRAGMFDIFCARGYTVFAVRPGTRGQFPIPEMVDHIKHAIRYIKENAEEYGVDPERLGITGPSAGGHLASLATLTAEPSDPDAEDPLLRHSTEVAAAGVFFPPTDFLNWGGNRAAHARLGDLYFRGGVDGHSDEAIAERAREISPRHQVRGKTVPFLIFHGDADLVVPLQQSEVLVEALEAAGSEVTLVVVPGGGHPWPTINEEIEKLADWFDEVLRK